MPGRPRGRRRRFTLLTVVLVVMGFAGPTASQLMPALFDGMPELAEAIRLAPEQRWESAKEALERAGSANKDQVSDASPNRPALSEQSKFP
ncbi:MAG TPA: hypothetical protein VNO31_41330, partial [Umezawaea sp.]|nr:hypothetical protein [Umezawaea sp.]